MQHPDTPAITEASETPIREIKGALLTMKQILDGAVVSSDNLIGAYLGGDAISVLNGQEVRAALQHLQAARQEAHNVCLKLLIEQHGPTAADAIVGIGQKGPGR